MFILAKNDIGQQLCITKVRPEMSEIMTFLKIASAEKISKIPFMASVMQTPSPNLMSKKKFFDHLYTQVVAGPLVVPFGTGVFRKYARGVFPENRFVAFVFLVQKYAPGRLIWKNFFTF